MDFSNNDFDFTFEVEKIRLLYGKYTHAAKIIKVFDRVDKRIIPIDEAGLTWKEVYGRSQQDAWDKAREVAMDWAAARRTS